MKRTDDDALDPLLDSIVGGEPVDWTRTEARAASGERSRLRALRDVSRVADFHRLLQRDVAAVAGAREVARWGDLLLLERVGRGASGDVHRAWDPALQREVALKLIRPRPGQAARAGDLLEEARALARVRDPHVVAIHGAAERDGQVGLWMEFLHGRTLHDTIAERGPLAPAVATRLGRELARALAAVHAAGTLHRDIKPANVMLERDGRAVLMDFGLGTRAAGAAAGPFSGTPMFMSPQRLSGAGATAADDVYALGATLRFAVTGAPPFASRTLEDLRVEASADRDDEAALAGHAPPELARAIHRAMARRPAERTPSAAALADELEALERQPTSHANDARASGAVAVAEGAAAREASSDVADSAPARAPASAVGTPVARWAAALAVAAFAVVVVVAVRQRPRPSTHTAAPPAASAPIAASPPAAAGAYDVGATFLKQARDGDVPLASGDRVGPGDRLSLEFHASRPVWVYVLDADDRGECYLLFPQPLFDLANPVPADSALRLPGTRGGVENAWTVTSRGGREHLLVIASPDRVPELEDELSRLPSPVADRPVQYARVGPATVERLRGIGGVSEVAPVRRGPAAVFDRIRALAGRERGVRGVWMRQITLDNPLR